MYKLNDEKSVRSVSVPDSPCITGLYVDLIFIALIFTNFSLFFPSKIVSLGGVFFYFFFIFFFEMRVEAMERHMGMNINTDSIAVIVRCHIAYA